MGMHLNISGYSTGYMRIYTFNANQGRGGQFSLTMLNFYLFLSTVMLNIVVFFFLLVFQFIEHLY